LSTSQADNAMAVQPPCWYQQYVRPLVMYRDANVIRYVTFNVRSWSTNAPVFYRYIVSVVKINRSTKERTIRFQQTYDNTGFNPNLGNISTINRIYSLAPSTGLGDVASSFVAHHRNANQNALYRKFTWDDVNSTFTFVDLAFVGTPWASTGGGQPRRLGFITPDGVYVGEVPYEDGYPVGQNIGMMSRRLNSGAPAYQMGTAFLGSGQAFPGTMFACIERVGLRDWAGVGMGINPLTLVGQPCVSLVRVAANGLQRQIAESLFLPADTLTGSATVSYLADNLFAVNFRAGGNWMTCLVGVEETASAFFPKTLVNYTPTPAQTGAAGTQWCAQSPYGNTANLAQLYPLMTKEVGGSGSGLSLLVPSIGGTNANNATRTLSLSGLVSKADGSGFQVTTTNSLVIGTGASATDVLPMDLFAVSEAEAVLQWCNYATPWAVYHDLIGIS